MRAIFYLLLSLLFLVMFHQANYASVNGVPKPTVSTKMKASYAPSPILKALEDNDKLGAIISYLGILGWLIAYIAMYKDNKTEFFGFHLRQALGNAILATILPVLANYISPLLGNIPFVGLFLWLLSLWPLINLIIGIINASKGEMKVLPLLGKFFDKSFSFIK